MPGFRISSLSIANRSIYRNWLRKSKIKARGNKKHKRPECSGNDFDGF
jgi:hypothetical protein